jgi:hypothetical protein
LGEGCEGGGLRTVCILLFPSECVFVFLLGLAVAFGLGGSGGGLTGNMVWQWKGYDQGKLPAGAAILKDVP